MHGMFPCCQAACRRATGAPPLIRKETAVPVPLLPEHGQTTTIIFYALSVFATIPALILAFCMLPPLPRHHPHPVLPCSVSSPSTSPPPPQVESMELASLLSVASPRALILVDEMCKGTEPDHGAALLAAALEALDASGCLGIVSTHFHRLLPLPLSLSRVERRAMSVRREGEGRRARRVPTWTLEEGECR